MYVTENIKRRDKKEMAKKSFYAVKIGRNPGIYCTWDECFEQVNKFPGAKYKAFASYPEAEEFMNKDSINTVEKQFYAVKKGKVPGIYTSWAKCEKQLDGYKDAYVKSFDTEEEAKTFMNTNHKAQGSQSRPQKTGNTHAIAYVDGSYNNSTRSYSCGVIILYNGQEIRLSQKFPDGPLSEMCNVAGEIEASKAAMKYCAENNINAVEIHYDYEGIAKWCTGEWKTKKSGTKAYKAFYDSMHKQIKISFVKVKGHSGNKYNDIADSLAKKAL